MVDLHSHILHEVDDGSRSLEESLEMIKSAIELGFTGIVCTSHYKIGRCENENYWEKFQELKEAVKNENLKIEIFSGNELYLSVEEVERLKEKNKKNIKKNIEINTYNQTKYLLTELNPLMAYPAAKSALEKIIGLGYTPIIAHMERNKNLKLSEMRELKNMGIPFQMNIASIGNGHKELAKKLLENRFVSFLTSDAHRSDKRNYKLKNEIKAIKELIIQNFGEEEFKRIIKNSDKVVKGEKIDLGKREIKKIKKNYFENLLNFKFFLKK